MARLLSFFVTFAFGALQRGWGCSDFYLAFDDYKLSARTMDLGVTANASLVVAPRGRAFEGRAPPAGAEEGGPVLRWTSK